MKLNNYIQQKKGRVILRDVVLISLIVSSVLVLASTFVTEMADNYGLDNMSSEYALTNISMTKDTGLFSDVGGDVDDASTFLDGNLLSIVVSVGNGATSVIKTFLLAPNRIGDLVRGILIDMDVTPALSWTIYYIIVWGLWIIVIFAIITAFLAGSEV